MTGAQFAVVVGAVVALGSCDHAERGGPVTAHEGRSSHGDTAGSESAAADSPTAREEAQDTDQTQSVAPLTMRADETARTDEYGLPDWVDPSAPRSAPLHAPCRPWPFDPADPRVGIYVHERDLDPRRPAAGDALLFFDGATVTTLDADYGNGDLPEVLCSYSQMDQLVEHLGRALGRYHAHVDAEGWLFALFPCWGWGAMGQFVGDRFESHFSVMRKLPSGAWSELYSEPRDPRYLDLQFRCYDIYESRAQPIPPVPPPPARWVRERARLRRRATVERNERALTPASP
jgi:hypothetical protein